MARKLCNKCGLSKGCGSPFLFRNEPHVRDYKKHRGGILVVGNYPNLQESKSQQFFTDKAGKFLRRIGGDRKVPVHYHQALSCPPEGNVVKPTHLKYCRKVTHANIIKMYRPQVIICFGANALYWATGEEELRLNQVRFKPFKKDGIWIIAVPHTSNDMHFCSKSNLKRSDDLSEEFIHAFFTAERICLHKGLYVPPNEVTIVTDVKHAMNCVRSVSNHRMTFMDVETGQSSRNPEALTHWHPKACHIMTAWCFLCRDHRTGYDRYVTFVLMGKANSRKINKEFCKFVNSRGPQKRTVVCHNTLFDFQVMTRFHFPIFKHAKFEDTFHMAGLKDQSKTGYGLKPMAAKFLGASDYDKKIKEDVKEMQKVVNRKAWGQYLDAIREDDQRMMSKLINTYPEMDTYYTRWKYNERHRPDLKIEVKAKMVIDYRHLDLEELATYCAWDVYWTARLYHEILKNPDYKQYSDVAYDICHRATRSLARIEQVGLPLDATDLNRAAEVFRKELEEKEEAFKKMPLVRKALAAGVEYNLKSKLFQKELVRVTKVSVPLTPKSKMPRIKKDEILPVLAAINKFTKEDLIPDEERNSSQRVWAAFYRIGELRDLESKFFNSYPKFVINGYIHTNFRILKSEKESGASYSSDYGGGTVTGRLSSANPQTQNIWKTEPVRKCFKAPGYLTMGRGMRDEFLDRVPRWKRGVHKLINSKTWSLVEIDYDRIELVFLAHLCQDERMCEALSKGVDLHSETARIIFGLKSNEDVPKDYRDTAKTLNFGLCYGQGVKAFAEECNIPVERAREFFRKFHKGYRRINQFYETIEERICSGEIIETLFGRRRSFKVIGERGYDFGQFRQAKNYVVQSPASDNTIRHLDYIYEWLDAKPKRHEYIIPVNTVHDSIHFLIDSKKVVQCCRKLVNLMQERSILPFDIQLPIRCGASAGHTMWDWSKKTSEVKL